jgi:hypothetical protein
MRAEKEIVMKRFIPHQRVVIVAAALMCAAGIAWAANPHFIRATTTLLSNGDLQFKFKEAGLGDAETTYVASASATATCTCVTNSGRCPNAANKVTSTEEVSTTGTFSPKNGTVSATLTVAAPECPSSDPPTCGGGQHLELSAITYTDISLVDTTNGVAASGLPSELSATYFTCP